MAHDPVEQRTEPINNVIDFLGIIRKLEQANGNRRICFRGHENEEWKLTPPIGRLYTR
jgi:hypothetical protein